MTLSNVQSAMKLHPLLLPAAMLIVGVIGGVLAGVAIDRFLLPHLFHTSDGDGNPNVTKDNYVRIQPGMTEWAVSDILGSGDVVAEQGYVVDAAGNYRKFSNQGGSASQETGTVTPSPGHASEEITQERAWRNGDKAIHVTFHNHSAASKSESGLFH